MCGVTPPGLGRHERPAEPAYQFYPRIAWWLTGERAIHACAGHPRRDRFRPFGKVRERPLLSNSKVN
jgi:hypothetical protein